MPARAIDRRDALRRMVDDRARRELDAAGAWIAREANARAPVGATGRLSRSYRYEVSGDARRVVIGSPMEYASIVEMGPRGTPHLAPAGAAWAEEAARWMG